MHDFEHSSQGVVLDDSPSRSRKNSRMEELQEGRGPNGVLPPSEPQMDGGGNDGMNSNPRPTNNCNIPNSGIKKA